MRGELLTRRFTDDETRRIFERAADAEARPRPGSSQGGHSIEELRAIAAEVGLAAAAVDRAAAEIVASETPPSRTSTRRFSTLVHEDAVIPRPLSNEDMRRLTSQIEQVIGRRGLLSDTGSWVEWRDSKDKLYVGLIRGDQHTRLRAIANQSGEIVFGSAVIGAVGLLMLPGAGGGEWLGTAAVLGGTLGLIGLYVRQRVSAGRRDLRELLDILRDSAERQLS